MRMGFVGLGIMGGPMARRLLLAGHSVTGHDRSLPAMAALKESGGVAADSPRAVAAAADVVMTALPTLAAVREVYEAMRPVARQGQVFVDHSTVDVETSRATAASMASRGAAFLDAPMSGGPEGANSGTLTLFVGGDATAFETALPALRAYGGTIRLCGPTGSGTVLKLANQLLVIIHTAATAEAAVFATRLGADPQVLLEMVGPSYGGSTIFRRHLPRIIARDFKPDGPLRILTKDMSLVRAVADAAGLSLPLASQVEPLIAEAIGRGMGDEDMSALVKLYEERSGTQVRRPAEPPPD
ncbi:MAG: NAD(P)-dependent oxidoreductase [Candidatus Dormibacteraeota bacterium]|nr:NAD(P)-dependent oxidoreductase [Candidatus Dormibacteraeota bacterium]